MKKLLVALCIVMLLVLVGCANNSVYTVNFIVEGEVVSTQQVKHGEDAQAPQDPELEGATFKEWDKDYKNVKENLDINAVFEKEEFTVIFLDIDGNVLKEEKVKYGEQATAPTAPELEGHTFKEWNKDITSIKENLEVSPVYEKIKFTVKFFDEDGTLLHEVKVAYGAKAVNPKDPQKHGYKFTGWDKDYSNVKENLDITATYELQTYTITYKDEEGNIIEGLTPSSYTINDDASLELPAAPEKEGYECLGWYQGNTRVVTFFSADAENKVFQLKYKELPKPLELPSDCTHQFLNIKKVLHSSGSFYVYQPDWTGLSVPSTSATAWEWSSLNPDIVTISQWSSMSIAAPGFAIIRAVNKADTSIVVYAVVKATTDGIVISSIEEANTKVEYEVTFTDENGNVIETQKVEEGKSANLPTPPAKEGYTFYGWSENHYGITSNITLEPTYIEGESDFAGKTVSIFGDSISTYKGYVPDGYSCFYPYPTADLGDVNQTWWMQTINKLGMKLLKNNSYSGTCVSSGTGNYSGVQDGRIKELLFGTETPDVILLFMGSNDAGSQYVSLDTFTSSYKVMLDKIIALCPESEIFIITLPPSKLYTEANRVAYNEVIVKYATEYNLPVVDMQNAYNGEDVTNYLVDSAHQNLAGMTAVANAVVKGMLKSKGIEIE